MSKEKCNHHHEHKHHECGCHEHHHEHKHDCGCHEHHHEHRDCGCGCGHNHESDCGCGHQHVDFKMLLLRIFIAIVLMVSAYFIEGIGKNIILSVAYILNI